MVEQVVARAEELDGMAQRHSVSRKHAPPLLDRRPQLIPFALDALDVLDDPVDASERPPSLAPSCERRFSVRLLRG